MQDDHSAVNPGLPGLMNCGLRIRVLVDSIRFTSAIPSFLPYFAFYQSLNGESDLGMV